MTDKVTGRIIRLISNRYQVLLEDGQIIDCLAKGKMRLGESPVCGDRVVVHVIDQQNMIEKILPRENMLIRPPIANVDQALIVMSAVKPTFSTFLVDQLLFLTAYYHIKPVIVVTKMDLNQDERLLTILQDYRNSGYQVYQAGKGLPLDPIKQVLAGKVSVLTGQSGVGKSTLINRLDPSFKLETQEISKALGRGKHTTRHVQLHPLLEGWVADTPGFSKLDFSMMSPDDLKAAVIDFQPYADQCRFRDCMHLKEPGCAIKQAVAEGRLSSIRYLHYQECLKMIEETRRDSYD